MFDFISDYFIASFLIGLFVSLTIFGICFLVGNTLSLFDTIIDD